MRISLDLPESGAAAQAYRDALASVADVELVYGGPAPIVVAGRPVDDLLGSVQWVAFWNAGIDHALTHALEAAMRAGLLVTNASGMHGAQMAEHALAMILGFTRGFPQFYRWQAKRQWHREPSIGGVVEELAGQTLGIVGLGHTGEALATRARAFDVNVIGVRRNHRSEELDELLRASDHVVLLVPLTPETRHLIDARRLGLMKKTARLYNLARGPVVDEAALVTALRAGTIAGAGLDVFDEEPLPTTSPFWDLENVIVSPHGGGVTPHYFRRAAAMFVENLARFRRGEPLHQLHDVDRGY